LLANKSVLQTYIFYPFSFYYSTTYAGIDTLADLISLTVPLVTPYLTTSYKLLNLLGLFLTILSMNGNASIADPSTTSIINNPLMCSTHSSLLLF
jgi:hypothetical protein